MRTTMLLVLAASTAGACKWTEFDDLANEAWVDSTGKPNVKSSDYGVAIQRGSRDAGRLVVLGAGDATYSELVYSAKGESSLPPTTVELKALYGIPNISPQPILLADPTTDDISLIVGSDNGIALLTGKQGTLKLYQLFNQSAPDAATYMQAPNQTIPLPIVAVGDVVLGALLPALPTGTAQPSCKLVGSPQPQLRALGAVRTGPADDLLAWDASGKLYKYPGTVFNGCTVSQVQIGTAFDTTFTPDQGSQILSIDATTVLLQGHHAEAGYLRIFNVTAAAITAVGPAVMVPQLRTAAILDVGGTKFVIAGVPTAIVDGKTSAGQVLLFKISAAGVDTLPVATFNDAQPDKDESFGRSVAALPFGGKQVIAVAADNEIFVYFRANLADGTALYGETRQGR